MKKLLFIISILIFIKVSSQTGSYTSREIDSLVISEGGSQSLMSIKSEQRQKEWQKINRNYFSREIAKYKLFRTDLIVEELDGKKNFIFTHTHCWKRPFGCSYITSSNKFIVHEW